MRFFVYLLFLMLALPVSALEKESEARDFFAKTTRNLYQACSTTENDAIHDKATAFCYGYILSALHYDLALHHRKKEDRLFCPQPDTSLLDVVTQFRKWVENNPQYLDELPVEGVMRSAMAKWTCR